MAEILINWNDASTTIIALELNALERWNSVISCGFRRISQEDVVSFGLMIEQMVKGLVSVLQPQSQAHCLVALAYT